VNIRDIRQREKLKPMHSSSFVHISRPKNSLNHGKNPTVHSPNTARERLDFT
jgi:hypothetical protein